MRSSWISTRFAAISRPRSRAKSASTRSRARSTPPTPASTRSSRSAWSSPSRETTSFAPSRSAGRTAARSRCGAAGRRRPARPLETACRSTRRSTSTGILEVNAGERWARVEPGIVLDELNAQLTPHGLRFAPDISTASRATIGGMMANNSSGRRSVMYGKTIDHVLEQHVVLSDGIDRPLPAGFARRARGTVSGDVARSLVLSRGPASWPANWRARSTAGFRRLLRRVGGYNLDCFVNPDAPFNLTKMMVGSEGTLGVVARSEGQARAAAEGQGGDGDSVRRAARGARSHTRRFWRTTRRPSR